jgi:glycosyltransferase involved in cell wall biosynthesis
MESTLRVLLVSPRYTPYIGGVEYVAKSIAERLVKVSHNVTVLAGEPSTTQVKEEVINGVNVIRYLTLTLRDAYHIPRMRNKLESMLKELVKEIEVVHVHNAHAILPVYVGIKVKEINPNIKLVFSPHYHAHGHTLIRELVWRILWRRYVRKLIRYADKIHAVSNVEAEHIMKHYPEARDKLVVIPNGVEEDVFRYKWKGRNSDYIMYSGRVEKYKRLEVAIGISKDMGLKLLVIGKGSHKKKLMKYAKRKYPEGVKFLDSQPRHKYLNLLSKARYAINPSRHEAFSIFIAEALAIGTPALISETIVKALKANVIDSIGDLYIADSAKIPSWNVIVRKYIDLYKNL